MATRHKREDSDQLQINECPWPAPGLKQGGGPAKAQSPATGATSRSRCGQQLASRENSGALVGNGLALSTAPAEEPCPPCVMEGTLKYKGVKVRVKSSHTAISWKPATGSMSWCLALAALNTKIPYDEVLGAWTALRTRTCSCFCRVEHTVVVAALNRPRNAPSAWELKEHTLVAPSADVAREWVNAITAALQLCYDRLLVFVNPVSGSRRARQVWEREASPIFQKAGIKTHVVETLQADHAKGMLASMKPDELGQYQGVVAVGGDGVFQECIMGLFVQRARGGPGAAAASRLRVGHVPGGSTDAVAYTLHGTRSAEAAALHIALGDRLALDVGRVDCDAPPAQEPTLSADLPAMRNLPADVGSVSSAGGAGLVPPGSVIKASLASRMGIPSLDPSAEAGISGTSLITSAPSTGSLSPQQLPCAPPTLKPGALPTQPPLALPAVISGHVMQMLDRLTGGAIPPGELGEALCCPSNGPSSCASHLPQPWPEPSGQPNGAGGKARFGGKPPLGPEAANGRRSARPSAPSPVPPVPLSSTRLFVCQAAYGFLGDVMAFSESLRFMGPKRYDVSGLVRFLALRSYSLQIVYRAAPTTAADPSVCSHRCHTCHLAGINQAGRSSVDDDDGVPAPGRGSHSPSQQPLGGGSPMARAASCPAGISPRSASSGSSGDGDDAPQAQPHPAGGDWPLGAAASASLDDLPHPHDAGWTALAGEFVSVMAVVTPCRSDKSRAGILPHAHLGDGRLYLVLVSACSRLQYLRFLLRLSSRGLEDGCFPFVKVVPITAAVVRPLPGAPESCWNVDGELLPSNAVRLRVSRGGVDVFARGVELEHPVVL